MFYIFNKSQLKTIKDYEKAHRDFWNFIANNHLSDKPVILGFQINIISNCFACEYAKHIGKKYLCNACPIDGKYCRNENGLYYKWIASTSQEEKDRIAREIAKAKFKEPKED